MPTGVMKRWNSEKGFGFIKPDDGGDDQFAHAKDLIDGEGSVREGDRCKFSIAYDDRKGKDHAVKVELLEDGGGGDRGRSRSRGRGGGDRGDRGGYGGGGGRESRGGGGERGDRGGYGGGGGGGGRRRDDSRDRGRR
eukprot:gnl/MRDRNA2_/MRDRNA2_28959_c0_seq1.p1 gnl/MRDRNA2_/MRDRNA2_28959_c0~~gnl/MRDRNA2_/MRDRNA2_28959_c0_seq1.p1  ORF type:complete len:161 (+),score=29.08 gnl/MRDRNA2_/MRDRNA2_28959_c0_seq1:73-483(+)